MCKSFSHSPQKLTFHMTGNQQEIVITFCSYVGVSYQKTPNCLPSLFFFSRYLSKAETTVDFLNICAGKCHLSHQIWPFPYEITGLSKLCPVTGMVLADLAFLGQDATWAGVLGCQSLRELYLPGLTLTRDYFTTQRL